MNRVRSNVVELRQYTLHDGKRDVLIDLFEREFVESQEATGMELIGQFRDMDAAARFVWLRGFPDMHRREATLREDVSPQQMQQRLSDPTFTKAMEYVQGADFFPGRSL